MTKKCSAENFDTNGAHGISAAQEASLQFDIPEELALVLGKIRILLQCRLEWLEHLVDSQANILTDDEPGIELLWRWQNLQPYLERIDEYDRQLEELEDSSLTRLIVLFGLGKAEVAILQTCLAFRLDPSLNNQLGLLQNQPDQPFLTAYAVARLWCFGRAFFPSSALPLMRWNLVLVSDDNSSLAVDPQIFGWLLGEHHLHEALKGSAHLAHAEPPLSNWPLKQIQEMVDERLLRGGDKNVLVQIASYEGQGRKTFAATLCRELGLLLLVIDAKKVDEAEFSELYLFAQRQAFLDSCAIAWINLRYDLPETSIGNFPLQFVLTSRNVAGEAAFYKSAIYVELPALDDSDKEQLWKRYLPHFSDWQPARQIELLRQPCTVADIVLSGKNADKDLSEFTRRAAQEQQRRLSGLADRLTTPFIREDWIVNDNITAMFDDIFFEGREREVLWQSPELNRLFPRGKGLVVMLTGPSGTGKTMGVQVAAAELGKELFRVDLSRVVSKYIGETAENLASIIQRAEKLNVILLFDEADALFSKRTDVRDSLDRHANMDINYLLQAIEDYSGIAFLATNQKSNIDQAFIRRLRYVIDFPLPDRKQRLKLWQRLLQSLAADQLPQPYESICKRLATQVELSGAQIKYSILSALFVARRLQTDLHIEHLLEGIKRELQKDGRSLASHECAALLNGMEMSTTSGNLIKVATG